MTYQSEVDRLREEVERLNEQADLIAMQRDALAADLARVRAALDREHICVMEACCNNAVRAALEGRG